MKLQLTREERRAILRGDRRALKRPHRPEVEAGDEIVVSRTRAHRYVLDRETGATAETPSRPNLWIKVQKPELRDGVWLVQYTVHDQRQPRRFLGAAPNPRSEEAWTPESERGYVGSAAIAIDAAEGVDDDTLKTFSAQSRNERVEFRADLEAEEAELREDARRQRERAIRSRLRERLAALPPDKQVALLAEIERDIEATVESVTP